MIFHRKCRRFNIPGAVVTYKWKGFLRSWTEYLDDRLPVLDMSRGGMRIFLHQRLREGTRMSCLVFLPGKQEPIDFKARLKWMLPAGVKSYPYEAGIQFNPYGSGSDHNPPALLDEMADLEERAEEINPPKT